MAHLPRGLCIAVVLWLALSRSSTASRTESPDSGQWWRTEEFSTIQKSAESLRKTGNYAALEKLYLRAINLARHRGNLRAQASYLTALGNVYVYLYRYTEAIKVYVEARDLAHANSDWLAEGAVAPGLSSVYLLSGDWPSARESAKAGLDVTRRLPAPPYYAAQLKLQHARLNPGAEETASEILQAIEAVRAQTEATPTVANTVLEAEAWDLLGEERLRHQDLPGAESALSQAYRLRSLHLQHNLVLSYWRLGALRLEQKRLPEAERFTSTALGLLHTEGSTLSARTLLHQRGLIYQAQGRSDLALKDFEAAARSAEHWRQVVPPLTRSSLAAADSEADRKVFRSFIEAVSKQALTTGDPARVRKSLLAAERNRAASLRQSADLTELWRRKLPPKYWQKLAQLRNEESRQFQNGTSPKLSDALHLELTEMEATAELGYSPNKPESFSSEESLTLFQNGLGKTELFLSFYTGAAESYLWAVTRDSLHLYKLPEADRIEDTVQRFRRAVIQRQGEAKDLGRELYGMLFGQLDKQETGRTAWILSLEGPLFELPVAALRSGTGYLVESHSLQITPSATWLRHAPRLANKANVGVGDAIYNWADERLRPAAWSVRPSRDQIPGQMNRLVASGEELERVANIWGKPATLLRGENASRAAFLASLSTTSPSNVYLATHVVSKSTNKDQAFLAFSIGEGGSPELLGTTDIGMLNVPGALVVMSGCSSGAGQASPGAGLLGLTRAWLSAGAQAVVATGWPVEDSRGNLLPAFYKNLSPLSNTPSTAEALRRGQVEMIHSGTWQADPASGQPSNSPAASGDASADRRD